MQLRLFDSSSEDDRSEKKRKYHQEYYQRNKERFRMYQKKSYQKNREQRRARGRIKDKLRKEERRIYSQRYRAQYPEKVEAYRKDYYRRNKRRALDLRRKKEYGLMPEETQILLKQQDEKCAGCFASIADYRFVVDHDHVTGAVRGLLCLTCNTSLGMVHDNPETLRNLARYLEQHSASRETTEVHPLFGLPVAS